MASTWARTTCRCARRGGSSVDEAARFVQVDEAGRFVYGQEPARATMAKHESLRGKMGWFQRFAGINSSSGSASVLAESIHLRKSAGEIMTSETEGPVMN